MFLEVAHTKLDFFKVSKSFVLSCYQLSRLLPAEERFNMTQQLRRAALSVHLNFAEGSSRRTGQEKKRFYEISRSSLIEVDTIFDMMLDLKYLTIEELATIGLIITQTFKMLSKMISIQKLPG